MVILQQGNNYKKFRFYRTVKNKNDPILFDYRFIEIKERNKPGSIILDHLKNHHIRESKKDIKDIILKEKSEEKKHVEW